MSNNNSNLHEAKRKKNDEYYTRYEDIAKELEYYKDNFKDKWVYCPCDDYRFSNFVKYFKDNFNSLNLKHLTATNYDIGDGAYRYDYDGETETIITLEGNGDFMSDECTKIKDECDIICTNPPFSLFRQFIAQILEFGKKFIIIGSENAFTYKETFPLLKNNKMWVGYTLPTDFEVPLDKVEDTTKQYELGGKIYQKFGNICWFTNFDIDKRREKLSLCKTYYGNEDKYPKYDNYDAINVCKVKDIPYDYDGVMGVPISFLEKHCPEQFEIVGNEYTFNISKGRCYINGKRLYSRIFIKKKQ